MHTDARFRIAVEAAPNGMIMIDRRGEIILANSQAEELFGYDRDDLLGRSIEDLVPERFRPGHPGFRDEFFSEPKARPMGAGRDLFGLRSDGEEFPVEIGLTPVDTEEGPLVLASIIDITARKRAEERIRASLEEKEVLLKEIHHRVKNNLQVISSLLRLQERTLDDEETRTLFRESRNRILSMAMIHERLYESESLASIDLGDYFESLIQMLSRTYAPDDSGVSVKLAVEPLTVDVDTAVPLALIVNELVSNAYKYAFPDGPDGSIRVELRRTDPGVVRLTIEDDGVGIPDDVDLDQPPSLGLRLVQLLSRQLQGEPSFESRGDPTRFSLEFAEDR